MLKGTTKLFYLASLGLVLLIAFILVSSCGGGGGGGRILPGLSPNQTQTGGGDNGTNNPPSSPTGDEGTPSENLTPPDVAKNAGEVGGLVIDAEGKPIDDLELYLNSTDNFVGSTDEEGKFLINVGDAGTYEVILGVEGEDIASFSISYTGDSPLNTVLAPPVIRSTSQDPNRPSGRLVGRVTDLEGNPIANVKVLVFDRSGFFLLRRTGEQGFYEFEAIPAGEYFLIGFKRGYRTHVGQVVINAGETTEHSFRMARLDTGGVKGRVTDPEGNPIPEAHVFLLYRERFGDGRRPPAFHRFTNSDGFYAFENVPAGLADILAFKPGFEPADAEVEIPRNGWVIQDFVLFPHEPPPAFSSLSGKVFALGNDPSQPGEPIPGAVVKLMRPNGEGFETRTNEDGFYKFVEVPSGPWGFRVSAEGFKVIEGVLWLEPGENHRDFFLPPLTEHRFGRVEGVVLWGESEEPVPGAKVELYVPWEGGLKKIRVTETDGHGYYLFEEVPAGFVVLKAFKGNASGEAEAQVPPGETVRVPIRIFPHERFGAIQGYILIEKPDGSEWRVPGALVKLFHGDPSRSGEPLRVTESNEDGFYKFPELEPSRDVPYVIIAAKEIDGVLWAGVEDAIFLHPGEVKEVNIWLKPVPPPPPPPYYSSLTGFVYEAGEDSNGHGAPIPGALVQLRHKDLNRPLLVFETRTDERGFYKFVEIPSGPYVFRVSAEGYQTVEGDILLWPGENHRDFFLRADMPPHDFGVIYGTIWRLIEDKEEVVPGALVLLFHGEPGHDNPPIRETRSNEEGCYEFGELPPSGEIPYFVVAKKEFDNGLWIGSGHTFLAPGEEKQLDIRLWPMRR